MPLTLPRIDDRKYQDLRNDALARIPVHNPEWTNFTSSDPGVTIVELFAFLTESLLYRANQIPERNRRKFLQLLGIRLQPATAARGIVRFANDRGPLDNTTLPAGLELRAGSLAFRLDQGLDVLPVEGQVFYKRELKDAAPALRAYYDQLYASFLKPPLPSAARLYQSVPLDGAKGIDLRTDTVDGSFWIALLARKGDVAGKTGDELTKELNRIRDLIASKTVTVGIVPWLADVTRRLTPGGPADPEQDAHIRCDVPLAPPNGELPQAEAERVPRYRTLPVVAGDVMTRPGTLQVTLPAESGLRLWTNLDPLEAGVGDFPPAIEDTDLDARVITWLRFSVAAPTQARILWAGINASMVVQRARVVAERLPDGTGAPDQVLHLAHAPVLADSVKLQVTRADGQAPEEWAPVEDLTTAGPEVPVVDPRLPPGAPQPGPWPSRVFALDAEAGDIRLGDGLRGARAPLGAVLVADYDYSDGAAGNVNEGTIRTGPSLPPGFTVTNPVRTWGGADAESAEQGEKQVQRWLQHRDRLVSAKDFVAITRRTPGVEIGRVDVIPAASPELGANEPGDAPGAVTLVVIPRRDPQQPDAPRPDRLFLDAICEWLEPRRLVTTEVFLRGPVYKNIWLSAGVDIANDRSIAEVRGAVEHALRATLSPLPPAGAESGVDPLLPVFTEPTSTTPHGWPLRRPVVALELAAVIARVAGVTAVRQLLLAGDEDTASRDSIDMRGLELPRIAGLVVSVGSALPLADVRGLTPGAGGPGTGAAAFVPVPVVPLEC